MGGNIGWLCWGLTSQSTIFQSCRDGAIASWVINQYFRGVKCLAQGHNTAAVGLEPRTSRSGVRHSTTEPPRSPGGNIEKNSISRTLESSFRRLRILHILWYHKIDVSILKITVTLWHHKYDFLISQNWFCDITKSARIFYIKIDFMISKNRFCDITKSWRLFWYQIFLYISQNRFFIQKIRFIFWYHKTDFVILKIDLHHGTFSV